MRRSFPILLYLLAVIGLFFYSYTQVDLNLTISRINIFQTVQRAFQEIGYFQRPISTGFYLTLIGMLFICYAWIVYFVSHGGFSTKGFWKLVVLTAAILVFSYPAFSYDLFNYLFAAKEVLVYHKNPYGVTPQQFIAVDPWVLFMRWIHLPSAYSPLWIGLTLPFYLFGLGFFLPTLFSFKFIAAASYLVTIYSIGKTLEVVDKPRQLLGMALFAFNPLVLVEVLVSAHNDSVMMAAIIVAYYFYVRKKRLASYFFWSISVALKLMTIVLLPLFFVAWKRPRAVFLMTIGLLLVVSQREVLPWYLLWIIPFVALVPNSRSLVTITTGASLGLLLRYLPYIYLGNWDPPAAAWKWWLTMIPIGASFLIVFLRRGFRRM